ncbi:MAG: hypothetical protein ABJB74_04860 [Gemmatimonas sp.]
MAVFADKARDSLQTGANGAFQGGGIDGLRHQWTTAAVGEPMQLERRRFLKLCCAGLTLSAITPATGDAMGMLRFDYPEHEVREFLKMHFAGSREFTARGLDKKERLLTRHFRDGIYKFFQRRSKSQGALPMVVDPFTGSQGATDYTVGKAKIRSEKAWVPVTITDGRNTWTIAYLMRNDQERNHDDWLIEDIEDVRGMLLSKVLQSQK